MTNGLLVDKNQFCKLLHMVIFVFKKKTVLHHLSGNQYQVIFILSQNAQRFAWWLKNVAFWTVIYYTCMHLVFWLQVLMFKKKKKGFLNSCTYYPGYVIHGPMVLFRNSSSVKIENLAGMFLGWTNCLSFCVDQKFQMTSQDIV